MSELWMPQGESPKVPQVRINVVERPPEQMKRTLVSPDKPFYAYACIGFGSDTRMAASGYGTTEAKAIEALEAAVSIPLPRPKAKATIRIGHTADPLVPTAPFTTVCVTEGCSRPLVRQYGAQARKSDWRHVRLDHLK